jgi:hypothetical protein
MNDICQRIHLILESAPLIRYPFNLETLPSEAIYVMHEDGETWGHGDNSPRIVQIGTQRDGNFAARLAQHFVLDEGKMDFDGQSSGPKDRSILRKTIGRALLNKASDPYLEMWNRDFTEKTPRERYGAERDIPKERLLEQEITELLRGHFSVRYVPISNAAERLGPGAITRRLIATVAQCGCCFPGEQWLGRFSPSDTIRHVGLWQVQYTKGTELDQGDLDYIEELVAATRVVSRG